MRKIIIFLLLILVPFQGVVYSMPVPSQPMPEEPVPVNGGGSSEALAGLADLIYIAIVLGVIVVSGVWMLVDNSDGNDVWGYAIVVPAAIIGISCI